MTRPPHWLIAAASILALGPALASCSTTTADPGVGHLIGVVYTRGGMRAETTPAEARLTAASKGDGTSYTYSTNTASDGSFSFELPQGTYVLKGTLTTRIPGGQTSPRDVIVTAGQATRVEVYAIYP
jgi:guanyl-specific ribonuclease Sa